MGMLWFARSQTCTRSSTARHWGSLERLKQRLQDPQGFHSYGQIQQFATELKLNIAYKTVYQLVRYRLNAKLKVPRPQSLKQHPESQSHFKKTPLRSNSCSRNLVRKA